MIEIKKEWQVGDIATLAPTPQFVPSPTWISVKDRLPEISKSVLVTDCCQVCIAFIQSTKKTFTQINTWDDWIHESITHWMPLPEPPNE